MQLRHLIRPAVALSLASPNPKHFDTAGRVAVSLLERIRRYPLPPDTILNVNIPDIPWGELRGFRSCRLGQRHRAEPVIRALDPRGREVYWVGAAGPEQDAGPGTDFHALREGYVSVTPLQIDLTRYDRIETLAHWLEGEPDR
jgi:5'-nucleotidase